MDPDGFMSEPLCLIENSNGQLVVNPEAQRTLCAITQPVDVVAIVGLYRTGKSYLMNKLAQKKKGFSVGSTVQAHTKGIWMWCMPHPEKPNHTLVLLDTEGLGDIEKGDEKNDTQIFTLAMLLSSTFIYNTMNKIDQRALDLLYYVTEVSNLLRTISSPELDEVEDANDIVGICPDLVWTLRDFFLDLEKDGHSITADEYLEGSLRPKQGTDQSLQNFNLPRLCIQKFFPKRKCFIFDSPAHRKKLAQLEELDHDELDPEFVQQVEDFCSYIFNHSKTKTLSAGIQVNGPDLGNLVLTYIRAISSRNLPCVENTISALAQIKNSEAVQKAICHYTQQMDQKVKLPTETSQELLDLHRACEKEALEVFLKNSFKDEDQNFQKKLEMQLQAKLDDFCKQNLKASSDRCSDLLLSIFGPLENSVKQGIYNKSGGHHLFRQKTEELKAKYYQEPRKGIQAEEALQKYLQSQQSMSDAILQAEQALAARQRQIEEERARAQAAQAEADRRAAIQREKQKRIEEVERAHQEHLRQMKIKNALELEEQRKAQERAHAHMLQEAAEQEKRRIEEERIRLLNQIHQLQSNVSSSRNHCILQ
ncbi:guanylate-binding protein 5 [Sorex araneus]|uniref:guanylate-binding protein 5 n=1 Tax=Sorex araneus TaxID=42254 RepID=UPI00243376E6|nr:guanylate-binding protein 5 [Sorex araneus]